MDEVINIKDYMQVSALELYQDNKMLLLELEHVHERLESIERMVNFLLGFIVTTALVTLGLCLFA